MGNDPRGFQAHGPAGGGKKISRFFKRASGLRRFLLPPKGDRNAPPVSITGRGLQKEICVLSKLCRTKASAAFAPQIIVRRPNSPLGHSRLALPRPPFCRFTASRIVFRNLFPAGINTCACIERVFPSFVSLRLIPARWFPPAPAQCSCTALPRRTNPCPGCRTGQSTASGCRRGWR